MIAILSKQFTSKFEEKDCDGSGAYDENNPTVFDRNELYLLSSGFHTDPLLSKSPFKKASRCLGEREQMWRNSHPP